MNYQLNAGFPGVFDTGTSLQLLVNRLVSSSQGIAFRNKITVVHEVPRDILMIADKTKVIPIIDELLTTFVANGRNSQIHISADRYRDIIILNIQDRNNYNGYALAFSIMSIESQINETGGSLTIDGKQKKIATVSFSFPNYAVAS